MTALARDNTREQGNCPALTRILLCVKTREVTHALRAALRSRPFLFGNVGSPVRGYLMTVEPLNGHCSGGNGAVKCRKLTSSSLPLRNGKKLSPQRSGLPRSPKNHPRDSGSIQLWAMGSICKSGKYSACQSSRLCPRISASSSERLSCPCNSIMHLRPLSATKARDC